MKLSRTLLVGLFVILLVPMFSCSKDKEEIILAEIKDRTISVAKFERVYASISPEYLPKEPGVEGYEDLLNTMLNKEVMAYKADELGYDKEESVIRGMDSFKKMGLSVAYLKFMVADKVKVSEEQVRQHYEHKGATLSVRAILCDTPTEADEVYALLEDGADFQSVCREHSKAGDAEEGGKIMTANYGTYAATVQREIFSLPVGGFTKPFRSPYGFHIAQVVKRTEPRGEKQPFEEVRETLEQEVRDQNERILTDQHTDKIRADAGVEWYWDNFFVVANAIPEDRSLTNPPSRRDEVYPLLYFDDEDLDRPLVSYKDVTIRVKDFSDYYDRASFFTRPRRENRLTGIQQFLMERVMAVLLPEEIDRANVEDIPEVSRVMNAKKEEFMVNRLYEDLINQQTVVTHEMIHDYYNEHKDFFISPETRRFGVILTGDIETAQNAYSEIQKGTRFRKIARAYSIDESTRETLGETKLLAKGDQPEMDRVGFELQNVGDVSEPFETSRGWMILKLTERSDEREYTLDESEDTVRKIIKQQMNEDRLNELLAKWKDELGVVIHKDNLKKIDVENRSRAVKTAVEDKT
jgi:parvulin-like peptidyl-prolyl isomerase